MTFRVLRRVLPVVAVLLAAVPARASFVAVYDFTGAPGNQASHAVSSNPAGTTFGDIVRGSGIAPVAAGNSINSDGWSTAGLDLNDYYGFTVTGDAGGILRLTQLAYSDRRSGTGPITVTVRYSLDGFATFGAIGTYAIPDVTDNFRRTFDLSGIAALQNVTGTVGIRIYGHGAEGAAGTYRLGVSGAPTPAIPANLTVAGEFDAPVPVPPSAVLLAIGGVGLFLRRRRAA